MRRQNIQSNSSSDKVSYGNMQLRCIETAQICEYSYLTSLFRRPTKNPTAFPTSRPTHSMPPSVSPSATMGPSASPTEQVPTKVRIWYCDTVVTFQKKIVVFSTSHICVEPNAVSHETANLRSNVSGVLNQTRFVTFVCFIIANSVHSGPHYKRGSSVAQTGTMLFTTAEDDARVVRILSVLTVRKVAACL